ncbi:MAG TPA: ISAs1 family transposase [Candidatus Acidoferrales bacterium]
MVNGIPEHFAGLQDPREARGRRHVWGDMLAMALCAVICGAEEWSAMEAFALAKHEWSGTFLALPHGIPSEDTFARVLAALDPEAFERCFAAWIAALAGSSKGKLIAIDGKTLRRSADRANRKAAIHMVSAWVSASGLCFGQLATDAKSNEITAIPRLLALLDLDGATVTIAARGCQKAIAAQIVDQGGDYVLALQDNQAPLCAEVKLFLDEQIAAPGKEFTLHAYQDVDGDHGRVEIRRAGVTPNVDRFADREQWQGLRSFAAVECERYVNAETTTERRYFISSLDGSEAANIAQAVRNHWRIENSLHWSLDVSFNEDMSRIRKGHGADNASRLRRMALHLVQQETTNKRGIKTKRPRAGWDEQYLCQILRI